MYDEYLYEGEDYIVIDEVSHLPSENDWDTGWPGNFTKQQVQWIVGRWQRGESIKDLAEQYEVSHSTIKRVIGAYKRAYFKNGEWCDY